MQNPDNLTDLRYLYATEDHLDKMNTLLKSAKMYWGISEDSIDQFMEEMAITPKKLSSQVSIVGLMKKLVMGFYTFNPQEGKEELEHFYIHPEYVGKGHGRRMWIHFLEMAREKEVEEFKIWPDVHSENFFIHLGAEKLRNVRSPFKYNKNDTVSLLIYRF